MLYPSIRAARQESVCFRQLRAARTLYDAKHGNGVGRGDQCAEQQCKDEAQFIPQQISCAPEQGTYDKRGYNGAERGKDRDGPLDLIQITQVHVQRPGKQQKSEKAVKDQITEIDISGKVQAIEFSSN